MLVTVQFRSRVQKGKRSPVSKNYQGFFDFRGDGGGDISNYIYSDNIQLDGTMRYKLIIIFLLLSEAKSFGQLDSSLARKLTISGFCLCQTTLADLKSIDGNLKEVDVEEMDLCSNGFTEDSRFENRKGYYSKKFPGIIFQKDNDNLISKIRLTKDFIGKLPDGVTINMKTLLVNDVLKLYPKFNNWGSRGCSNYWNLSNDTLSFFVKIDRKKLPQYPIDKEYYLQKPIEGIDLVMSCYSVSHKSESFTLFPSDEPMYFIDSIRTNQGFLQEAYKPSEIAFVTVFKDNDAIKLAGQEGKNGVIYITTKSYARQHYWTYFKSKSSDYLHNVPNLEAEKEVIYILNGKVLSENYESNLFNVNDSNLIELRLIDKKELKSKYNISDKKIGFLINTKLL